ncbi:MAG: 2-C-methyl-D-erythritol 4-phosphate cytidylyltransferase [Verrucomicrobiota bacterium]
MNAAVLVAAGSSRRMGFDKLAAELCGKTVLERSLEALVACEAVQEVVVVSEAAFERPLGKAVRSVAGGPRRQDSVRAGVEATSEGAEWVAVHDAARPLVTSATLNQLLRCAEENGSGVLAARVVDSLSRASSAGLVEEALDREGLWAVQTPQVFRREILREALAAVDRDGVEVTDEIGAVRYHGGEVRLMENLDWNLKITHPRDLELARWIWREREHGRDQV